MKKSVKVEMVEVEQEGLIALMDKRVLVFCLNYIYVGTLEGVNDSCIKLKDAAIVYSTGTFTSKTFEDAQKLPFSVYVQTSAIESFSETDKR